MNLDPLGKQPKPEPSLQHIAENMCAHGHGDIGLYLLPLGVFFFFYLKGGLLSGLGIRAILASYNKLEILLSFLPYRIIWLVNLEPGQVQELNKLLQVRSKDKERSALLDGSWR